MASTAKIHKYGIAWPSEVSELGIELEMIRRGGVCTVQGKRCGNGLLWHYLEARRFAWPKRYRHRWTDEIYSQILKNQITIIIGCASSQKTSHIAEYCLLDYWAFPNNTFILVSTVTVDKLETNIFGELKMLYQEAKDRFPDDLAGHLLDYKHAITTDSIRDADFDEARARDMRKGIMGRACYSGHQYVGLGVFAGIKQERFRFVGDELQYMAPTFMDTWPHMFSNPDCKIIASGNPNHDPDDQLGLAAEPIGGWSSMPEPQKTSSWPTRKMGAVCLNLVGTDSPNLDHATDIYPRLIGRNYLDRLVHDFGLNSPEYYRLGKGVMKMGMASNRVLTRQACQDHRAHESAVWAGTPLTKVHALDPAYGGKDRCVSMRGEFGEDTDGKIILRIVNWRVIQINLQLGRSPEEQIVDSVFDELTANGIPPRNSGYDSFGRGTLGFAFTRKFGSECPVPVDSGGRCTSRPVREGLTVYDEVLGFERLKRCDEHYSKFVTEMWFSVRYAVESEQIRELPEAVALEGCWREYYTVAGDKIEVEPKDKLIEHKGKSPDLFDTLAIMVEMARRRGFKIDRIGFVDDKEAEDGLETAAEEYDNDLRERMLAH